MIFKPFVMIQELLKQKGKNKREQTYNSWTE